ncbi:MAG: transposase [Caldilineaceae bacterium]|jgi:transposase
MAMGRMDKEHQETLWIETCSLPRAPGHPFYEKLNGLLAKHGFDAMVEAECVQYYAEVLGRPSIPPVAYFKALMVGYFEGIDSERGIAWRVADSMALRSFLGYELTERTPDHSSLSRTRRLISVETHRRVFHWVLDVLAKEGFLRGKTLGVDATTLEANAALRSIVRRDTGEGYEEFLTGLAKSSGIETPTREDLAKLDKKRPKKGSNTDWKSPHDPDARITKMKDGRTHLAHKVEHAVDMDTGAVVSVTLQPADLGDTQTVVATLDEARANTQTIASDARTRRRLEPAREVVLDKGYHSNETVRGLHEDGLRTYVSEPKRGRRRWEGKTKERDAVYANRRRVRGAYGKKLLRKRGELIERSFAHCYETGAMRRTHLRHHANILKRLLIHVGAFNLSLVFRRATGFGTPRGLQERAQKATNTLRDALAEGLRTIGRAIWTFAGPWKLARRFCKTWEPLTGSIQKRPFATDC